MHVQRVEGASGSLFRAAICAMAIAMLVAVSPSSAQQTPPRTDAARPSFDQLYDQGQRRNAAMQTLTARFTETTTSALLTRPLVARGTLAVQRPARVALRYSEPDNRVIIIDDKTLTSSWPTRQTMNIATAMGRVQKQFVDGTAADLRREFEIDDSRALDTPGTYYVSMTPKRKQIREALAKLDLWVDRDLLLLQSMRMTFAGGETKTMTFEDVAPNATLPPGIFTIPK
jgi:outer membrane lipoprotein-sorting protein